MSIIVGGKALGKHFFLTKQARNAFIIDRFKEGVPVNYIAQAVSLDETSIYRILRSNGYSASLRRDMRGVIK